MASSVFQSKPSLSYNHPIPNQVHSASPHFTPGKPMALEQLSFEGTHHPTERHAVRHVSYGQQPGSGSRSGQSPLEERLSKLEASLPIIHDIHQREIAIIRSEIESLKAHGASKPALNKDAPAFVPGPGPTTPTTPADMKKPPPLSLGVPNMTSLFELPSPLTPPSSAPFDALPQHEQIKSLSQQVNVLSTTISQLLTTLLASPGPINATISHTPPAPGPMVAVRPNGLPMPSPVTPTHGPLAANPHGNKMMNGNHGASTGAPHRHPGNLTFRSPLELMVPQSSTLEASLPSPHLVISPALPTPDGRLGMRFFPPGVSQTPLSATAPLSPSPYEPVVGSGAAMAPVVSLAGKWEQLGISGDVLRALVRFGIGPPTKTQQKSIPCMLLGKDLVSQSNPIQERIQSYVIPALQLIANDMSTPSSSGKFTQPYRRTPSPGPVKCNSSVKVLVITATLDEAAQAHRLATGIAALLPNPPKVVHCGAGDSVSDPAGQAAAAHHLEPHLLIGTPSKLLDPVNGLRGYTFDAGAFICVVMDEMDQLLARNLADMVTSLMAFLPSNVPPPDSTHVSPSSTTSCGRKTESGGSPTIDFGSSDDRTTIPHPRQSPPQNAVPSPAGISETKAAISGRQTCIFSCTVPQDVLSYARTLNLRARVLVRREEASWRS